MSALILPVVPAPGPAPDAVPVRLPGGLVVALRPLRRGEREPLLAVFDGMSSASRARRYLTGMVRLPSTMLEPLTAVDGHLHVAWLASIHGRPVGIARCVRDDAGVAEVAVEVVDDHHGLGIASALVDAVTTVAAARGVAGAGLADPGQRTLAAPGHPHRCPAARGRRPPGGRGTPAAPGPAAGRPAGRPRAGPERRGRAVRHALRCHVHSTSTAPQQPSRRLESRSIVGPRPTPRKEPPCPPPTSITPRS